MKISVVIPAYNASQCISRAIESVLAQSFSDYEIIVINDGSTDNTAEVVESFGSKVHYIYQENAGDGPARNAGIAAARGDWIAFLDADDEWLSEKLRCQLDLLERNPHLRWCSTNRFESLGGKKSLVIDRDRAVKALEGAEFFPNYFVAAVQGNCPIITSAIIVRRDVFGEVGVFDTCWERCADIDLWWRIAHSYPEIGYVADPLAVRYLDAENPSMRARRYETTKGFDSRKLIGRHLAIAKEKGDIDKFRDFASMSLRRDVMVTLYYGYKQNTRDLVREFKNLFPLYWRVGIYLLTIFPAVTSGAMKMMQYLISKLGLRRKVSRSPIQDKPEDQDGFKN